MHDSQFWVSHSLSGVFCDLLLQRPRTVTRRSEQNQHSEAPGCSLILLAEYLGRHLLPSRHINEKLNRKHSVSNPIWYLDVSSHNSTKCTTDLLTCILLRNPQWRRVCPSPSLSWWKAVLYTQAFQEAGPPVLLTTGPLISIHGRILQ